MEAVNIDEVINELGAIDDLQAIAEDYLKQRKEEIVECERIISEKVKALLNATHAQPSSGDEVLRGASRIHGKLNA